MSSPNEGVKRLLPAAIIAQHLLRPLIQKVLPALGILLLSAGFGLAADAFEPDDQSVDYILLEKLARKMTLYSEGKPLKQYRVSLGRNPTGPKIQEGDQRTPEGLYLIDFRNDQSEFHLSLRISYPNDIDKARAEKNGHSPGGNIMIHGIGKADPWIRRLHPWIDWTKGCIAVMDHEIEEIWRLVPIGTLIEIKP